MKQLYLYIRLASVLLLLSACAQDNMPGLDEESATGASDDILTIHTVEQTGFRANQSTRSSYTGYAIKFENDDKLGLILIDDNEQIGNVPFSYTEAGGWVGGDDAYYTSAISKIIAYYPYNESLPTNVASLEALKNTVEIKADQSSLDDFKQMDLLVCEIANPTPELDINFEHAFSLIELSAKSVVTVGDHDFEYNMDMSDVGLSIGDDTYTVTTLNGAYVCLVKDGLQLTQNGFRYFYTLSDEVSAKTINTSIFVAPGMQYTFPCTASSGESDERTVAAGDFYCVSKANSNQVVIIPSNAATIPDELTCKGVVFHVMEDGEFEDFKSMNELREQLSGYKEKHGLVVSLKKGQLFGTGSSVDIGNALKEIDEIYYTSKEVCNGYKLTQGLLALTSDEISFTALTNHTEGIPNATSWYIPSFKELTYLIKGEDAALEDASTSGKERVDKSLKKIEGADELRGTIPSITFYNESPNSDSHGLRLMTDGIENNWHGNPGGEDVFYPICAF
ncbi:MAG: hypothetical protein EGP81_08175 [Bacteroides clarus]|uniref:fimbrillin family protein n=1 Tax=Bacteroides clarus TaxID=626929 RepID=UPI00241C84E0|nr:fimbrillin family protein [Bacteroides clarus]MBD9145518.1 hypothetical protein [Bacteroides clarus]